MKVAEFSPHETKPMSSNLIKLKVEINKLNTCVSNRKLVKPYIHRLRPNFEIGSLVGRNSI